MNSIEIGNEWVNWQQQASQCMTQRDYGRAAIFYEQAIEAQPNEKSLYWLLGIALLLQGQEAEAQTTWLVAMSDGNAEQIEQWTAELLQILKAEAERQSKQPEHYSLAWAVRQHIRELNPIDLENLLHILLLSIAIETYSPEDLETLGILDYLQADPTEQKSQVNEPLLLESLELVLDHALLNEFSVKFAQACLPHISESGDLIATVLPAAVRISFNRQEHSIAADLAKICLQAEPDHLSALMQLTLFYQQDKEYSKGIEAAKHCLAVTQKPSDQIFANYLLLRGLMGAGGYWQEAHATLQQHETLALALIQDPPPLNTVHSRRLTSTGFFPPYFQDQPQRHRSLLNQLMEICQANMRLNAKETFDRYQKRHAQIVGSSTVKKPLKIGYLSYCFYNHSVGWLARWLLKHHDRDRFQIHVYFVNYKPTDDFIQRQYTSFGEAHKLGIDTLEIADQIHQDEIDILVDLDSITLDVTCEVVSLKPAPVQVTWLGWDAPGLSAIDYFIADPYVLPESAQDYYTEKIWRLPQTYIAVDGFEVDVPTIRRSDLDIPKDAIVYLSAQRGYKRHPETTKLQMQILKAVPDSYLLIKGLADQESMQNFFTKIAEEVGVSLDRLRFLPQDPSETVHRANLAIADIVLDTFPYNGATTTLETLWMEIPLVTRVGQQFAARNSYTMLVNAGITEGIAWTDEEYVEWGVRLGKDSSLRRQVAWKLRESKQTAPLWDAKQFTHEIEAAYEQMWETHVGNASQKFL